MDGLYLNQEQIAEIDKLYLEKCEEVNRLRAELEKLNNCSNCSRRKFYQIGYESGVKSAAEKPAVERRFNERSTKM